MSVFNETKSLDDISAILKEDIFKDITEHSKIGIFIYSESIIYANHALAEQSGYTLEELYSMNVWEFADESCKNEVKEIVLKRHSGELLENISHDFKFITKSGEIKDVRTTVQTIHYNDSYFGMGTVVDVTDLTKTKQELSLLAKAIEQTDDMVKITDKDGKIVFVNDSTITHSGYDRKELIGQTPRIFKSAKHDVNFYQNLWSSILSGETFKGTIINKKKDGHLFHEQETITPIYDDNKGIKYFVVTSKDVTEQIEMEQELCKRATVDYLTGIYNRQKCIEQLEIEMDKYKRYNNKFVIIMLDIDDFKNINDTYGHDIGDNVLVKMTEAVSKTMRRSDMFARWGGEEFMIIAPDITVEEAIKFSEKIREKINSIDFEKVGHITASLGITFPRKDETQKMLLKRVDDAMYISKANGKNQTHLL